MDERTFLNMLASFLEAESYKRRDERNDVAAAVLVSFSRAISGALEQSVSQEQSDAS